jgi:hypothetical protein
MKEFSCDSLVPGCTAIFLDQSARTSSAGYLIARG